MAISPVSGGGTSTLNPGSASNPQSAALSQADFLKLLMAQMKNQDPLSPVSGTDFTSQMAQFSQLQSLQQLNANFGNQLQFQQLTQGAALIGKTVLYNKSGATTPAQGVVSAVTVNSGSVVLQVGSDAVALGQVVGLRA